MRMQHVVNHCVRNLVSAPKFEGRFSKEMEAFWHNVEMSYRRCGIPSGVPQDHVPLWWARALDAKIPVEFKEEVVTPVATPPDPDLPKVDMRTKEGKALKAQMVPAGV